MKLLSYIEVSPVVDITPAPHYGMQPVQPVQPISTREEWLHAATNAFKPIFVEQTGRDIPDDVRITCGWPAGTTTAIGQCFPRSYSTAGVNEIFISPKLDDASRVLDVLAHELVHAIDDCKSGHKGDFARMARALNMQGKLTATTAGPTLRATCDVIVERIGPYPHAALDYSARKKQTTRMLRHECGECGAIWRAAGQWQMICCPCCTAPLGESGESDE